jgi:branched-chain amino acid transport system substrate-binding protein
VRTASSYSLFRISLVAAACACGPPEQAVIGYAFATDVTHVTGDIAAEAIDALSESTGVPVVLRRPLSDMASLRGDGSDAATFAIALRDIPHLMGAVGPGSSELTLQTVPLLEEEGIPQVIPTATSGYLADVGPWTFTMAPTDSAEGVFIAEYVAGALGASRVGIFYTVQEYGLGIARGVRTALQARGAEAVFERPVEKDKSCVESGSNPYMAAVEQSISRTLPEAIVVAGREWEAGCIARALNDMGLSIPVIAGDGAAQRARLSQAAGDGLENLATVAFWVADSEDARSRAFVQSFVERTGDMPNHGDALAFDASVLLATAVIAVGPNRARIRDYLASLGVERPPYPGVTGPISFEPGAHRRMLVTRMLDGDVVVEWDGGR